MADTISRFSRLREIPPAVWALGFVSLLMDVSSEIIHALLPVYLVTVLGASMLTVGFIEGIAEATASITKVFSGALSDWLGKRKLLAVVGYGLAAFTKPIFPLASSVSWLVAARFIDRIGKGIRGAPRDALVADVAPTHLRGASFGLRSCGVVSTLKARISLPFDTRASVIVPPVSMSTVNMGLSSPLSSRRRI
jgi:Na+/melibiose symporter-like transporter